MDKTRMSIKEKIRRVRIEASFQIKKCYQFVNKERVLHTHFREFTTLLHTIPITIKEFESLLEQYIQNPEAEYSKVNGRMDNDVVRFYTNMFNICMMKYLVLRGVVYIKV